MIFLFDSLLFDALLLAAFGLIKSGVWPKIKPDTSRYFKYIHPKT